MTFYSQETNDLVEWFNPEPLLKVHRPLTKGDKNTRNSPVVKLIFNYLTILIVFVDRINDVLEGQHSEIFDRSIAAPAKHLCQISKFVFVMENE